ncbi:unnamed protein product [Cylindrotheca closterium]|uniref:Uncharacterized protein n=1 Tax=Cylindrotheca closterium TaxID=2856 RepID=A0AAD2G536_9STRA|nr:unnamed protein product [Cylindrotheca closterium]
MSFLVSASRSCRRRERLDIYSSNILGRAFSSESSETASNKGSQVMQASYQEYSEAQYSAHIGCQDMLLQSIQRWGQRIKMEDKLLINSHQDFARRRRMADLGSADGSNSIQTLSVVMESLTEYRDVPFHPLDIVLEEHPESDENHLNETLSHHQQLFEKHNARYKTLMKSFYEPLFPPNSMDFIMSHLSLHWLDTADTQHDASHWKALHRKLGQLKGEKDEASDEKDFVFVNEKYAPLLLQDVWREELAMRHLANFLMLRATELRPGAELFMMMVGEGHAFVCPPNDNSSSLLTIAMKKCIEDGTVREEVLTNAFVPYYLRNVTDIYDAVNLMNNKVDPNNGPFLEVVDAQYYAANTGVDIDRACELFWSIHGGAVTGFGNATNEECVAIRSALALEFKTAYSSEEGIIGKFVACVLRRRTRKPWSLGPEM